MALSIRELSKEGQDTFKYLDDQPKYLQGFVTDCIVNTGSIFAAADMFDAGVEDFIKTNCPEKLEEYNAEWAPVA